MTLTLDRVSTVVGGETHIHPVSMTLEKGSLNVLLGPTSSGKTSLMRLMAGLDVPTSGRVLWNGEDVTGVPVQKRNIAMVYQQFINYPAMTVYDNIASPLRIEGVSDDIIDTKVREAAELMKLGPMLDRKPLELSGGQQQRTALARALVKGADLVLLDEPLANLDYKLREELREELPRLFAESGAVFVYATTEPSEALLLGGATACLWEGKVTQFGPTLDVYRVPTDATTARVFSDPPMNFASATKANGKLTFDADHRVAAEGVLASFADGDVSVGFRPDHLKLSRPSEEALSFRVTVEVSEITGSESFVHVTYGDVRWVALTHGIHEPELGSTIEVYVEPRHLYVFAPDGALLVAPSFKEETR